MICEALGRIGYEEACAIQETLRRRILDGDPGAERLLLVEHDPVITLGRSTKKEHLLVGEAELRGRGVALAPSSRGGDVTWHGPGQLVAYPVMRLRAGVVAHIERLAQAAVEVARGFGVEARFRRDCPGVWVGDRKLASIGVHVHRRVAIHGLALNVAPALDGFALIVPCGLQGTRMTSLSFESGRSLRVEDVIEPFTRAFLA